MKIKSVYKELGGRVEEAKTEPELNYLRNKGDSIENSFSFSYLNPKHRKEARKYNLQLKKRIKKRLRQIR